MVHPPPASLLRAGFDGPSRQSIPEHAHAPHRQSLLLIAAACVLFFGGCYSIAAVNNSATAQSIEVAALTGEEGQQTTLAFKAGEIDLDAGETTLSKFTIVPYSVIGPGSQHALLRFDAGNDRVERVFAPLDSICKVTMTPEGYLDATLAPAPDDVQLRDELLARISGLQQAIYLDDTFSTAAYLLSWCANNTDDALENADDKATLPLVVNNSAAYAYHELFRRDRGAVFCGGFAVMYQKVLLAFGIDALVIDFGDVSLGFTHMSVVIPQQKSDGTWKFYQFDPKLYFRCRDSATGIPLDVFEVMDREIADLFQTVTIVQGSNDHRDFVGTSALLNSSVYKLDRIKGSRYIYRRPGYSLAAHLADYGAAMEDAGLSPGAAGFFELMQRNVYTVRRGSNQASRDAFVNELVRRQIPLIYPNFQ